MWKDWEKSSSPKEYTINLKILAINNQEYVEILERPCDSPNNIDRENLLEDSSSTKSFDSAYDAWSRFGNLGLEQVEEQVKNTLRSMSSGVVQIKIR